MPPLQQARAFETRELILQGAARIFARKGYEGTTIADIVEESGVTKGAMYFHFKSKEELGKAIVFQQTELLQGSIVEENVLAAQALVDMSYQFALALQADPLVRASVRMATEGHGFATEQRATFDAWLVLGTDLGQRAIDEGDIRPQWTAREVAQILTTGVNGIQQSSLIYSDYEDMLDRLHVFWHMLEPGLFTSTGLVQIPRRLSEPLP